MILSLGQDRESEKRNIVDYVKMTTCALRIPQFDGPRSSAACALRRLAGRTAGLESPAVHAETAEAPALAGACFAQLDSASALAKQAPRGKPSV